MALPLTLLHAQTGSSDPGGVLRHLTVARFVGSGADSIQAMTSDAAGNLYVAGTTSSPDLPMKNAAQPAMGEAPLMRSLDRGLTWQKVGIPPIAPLTITPHPSDPQTLFLGAPDGIYKTTDGGQTWRHVYAWDPAGVGSPSVFNIAIDPAGPRQAYAYVSPWNASPARFLTSADGGDTWNASAAPFPGNTVGSGARLLWVDPLGSGTVALGMYLSRDHGTTWTSIKPPPEWTLAFTTPDPRHAGWLFAATSAGSQGRLYLSTDWGVTWTEKASLQWRIESLLVDPDLPNRLYASAASGLYVSDDGAASWRATASPGPGQYVSGPLACLNRQCTGGALLALAYPGQVVSSLDFGATWQPPQLTQVVDLMAGPGCAIYAVRSWTSDAFVAKLSPGGGEALWSTFLGGADADASVGIALDPQGNVYVTGHTASADFPATAPRFGQQGRQNLFAAKFDPDGKPLYSVVLGGESSDTLTAMAVGPEGDVHLVGRTMSKSFPATPGAYQTQAGGTEGGFVVRLAKDGRVVYASYLPQMWSTDSVRHTYSPVAVAAEAGGSALIGGGYGGVLSRIAPDGSSLTAVARVGGVIYVIEKDGQDNVYVAGQAGGPSGSAVCSYGLRPLQLPPGDIFVTKLRAGSLEQVCSARLYGNCQSWPGVLRIGATGEVTVGLWTWDKFPLRSPVLATPRGSAAVVSRLSADGSVLLFSSYLDMSRAAPAIALGPDDSLYAGVTRAYSGTITHAGVLRLPVASPGAPSVENAFHAFGGDSVRVAPGVLMTITGQNLSSDWIDLGLNHPDPLPTELGGVQVLFDGQPAQMFQVTPERLICVVPADVKDWTTVQVVGPAGAGTSFLFETVPYGFGQGLLTRSFPDPPPARADGNIRNADGTLNDAQHPAALGSTVTLFATGLSGPGQVALAWAPTPREYPFMSPIPLVYGTADTMPGFISALYQIRLRIPDALGAGVTYLPPRGVVTRVEIQMGNTVGIYVK